MCVKCQLDGELPVGRKAKLLAVHSLHPAAAHDRYKENTCMRSFRTTAKEVFFMLQMKKQFADSFEELKNLRTIVVTALLIAIAVVLGFFSVQLTENLKIGFSFIANELTAMLFGPVVGGIMGGVADIIKYLLKPTGPFFFGFTFNAILGAVIYGVMLYKKPISFKRILASKIVVAIVVNVFLNTYWLSMLYGNAFMAILPPRLIKQIIMVPIQSIMLYAVVEVLAKAKVFSAFRVKV